MFSRAEKPWKSRRRRAFSPSALPSLLAAGLLLGAPLAGAAPEPSAAARTAFDRGESALAANQLDSAAVAYREALAATPGYAAALNGLGTVAYKQGRKDEALSHYRSALEADPDYKLAHFNLGYALRKSSDYEAAARAYERYTQLEPEDPDGFYGLAESYRQSQQPQKALAAYEAYLRKENRPAEQKYVAKAKAQVVALKASLTAGAAPAKSPEGAAGFPVAPPAPVSGAAAAGGRPGTPPSGAGASPTPIVPSPSLCAQKLAEGDRLLAEKSYREASFAYQDAVNADPNNLEALFKLGNAYAVLGYYSQAIDRWTRVAQAAPNAAWRKSAEDNIAKARSRMALEGGGSPQAQGKAPGSGPVAESTRARARQAYEQGVKQINAREYGAAVQALTSAITLEPTLVVAYVARGSAHIGLRRFADAAADYQYALKLDGSLASPLYGLAEAYRGMGRPGDAKGYYERYVVSTAPDVRAELKKDAQQKAGQLGP